MNYKIMFFSGTGGTKLAAEKLKSFLDESGSTDEGSTCDIHDIGKGDFGFSDLNGGMIIVMYPVHAFGAPIPVYDAIDKLSAVKGKPAAVISISAGGEVSTNSGCRIKAKRKLRAKGYSIVHEDMIMMPSNWAVRDSEEIESIVINALDSKVKVIGEIISDSENKQLLASQKRISLYSRIMAAIGTFSRRIGFPIMGKFYKASDTCNGCSLCAAQCPQKNIKMMNGKPRFGWKCVICMKCIYACPMNSISAGPFNFMIVDGGYDIQELTETAKKYVGSTPKMSGEKLANDKAVIDYINNINDVDRMINADNNNNSHNTHGSNIIDNADNVEGIDNNNDGGQN